MMIGTMIAACTGKTDKSGNPFFQAYENEYGAPPFEQIKNKHFLPAFEEGIKQHQAEIDSIANNPEAPTFVNTIEAMEYSGELLNKVSRVFFNLTSAETNDEIDKIAEEITPKLTEHNDNIYLNDKLFQRVKAIHNEVATLGLTAEQERVLDKIYKRFVRSGADLNDEQKVQLREINKELSSLELKFGQNILAETNAYKKFVTDKEDLKGLPESVIQAAAEAAKDEGKDGQWLFTVSKTSFIPVLQYGENRELRKELLLAYANRCNNDNEFDNKEIISEIMKLRVKKANLLGFESPAAYILDNTMAKTPEAVYSLLNKMWTPALAKAKVEAYELQKLMDAEGKGEKLEAWDWWYYTEKLRKENFDLDEEELRPYFKLENVRKGVFDLTTKLFGLHYEKLEGMPVYHKEVETFKVTDDTGKFIGILYTDYFPRPGKTVGAWMSSYKNQFIKDSVNHRPIVVNVGNFTRPTSEKPSLMTMDEVETLFHEFGHALHGLLANSTYPSLSGTNVSRDFVELPSQIMENWCWEPEVMKTYAFHYETGEVMPQELMDKIQQAGTFNQGFVNTELLSASFLDMDYHIKTDTSEIDVTAFEKASLDKIGMIPEIIVRYKSPIFKHIFEGGYSAGYYSYSWAAVLDADAYQAFKESGDIYNKEVAESFKKNILEKGDSDDPMKLYRAFRGADPNSDALLKKRGLK
jgi:peptidyl-dipeptidase Dcp